MIGVAYCKFSSARALLKAVKCHTKDEFPSRLFLRVLYLKIGFGITTA